MSPVVLNAFWYLAISAGISGWRASASLVAAISPARSAFAGSASQFIASTVPDL